MSKDFERGFSTAAGAAAFAFAAWLILRWLFAQAPVVEAQGVRRCSAVY